MVSTQGLGVGAVENELTRHRPLDSQTHRQNGHQGLVSHRINHRADYRLQVPLSRDPAIDQISNTGVGEESKSPRMVIMYDEIATDRSGDQTGEGKNVRNGVDVFVWCEGLEGGEERFFGWLCCVGNQGSLRKFTVAG